MRLKIIIKLIVCFGLFPALLFSQEMKVQDTISIKMAYDEEIFFNLEKNDAVVALNQWAKSFVKDFEKKSKVVPHISIHFIDNLIEVLEANSAISYDLLNMLSTDYILHADRKYWIPIAVSVKDGQILEEYLLLVHEESGITDLKQLQGKSIGILKGADTRTSRLWLDNLTLKDLKMPAQVFFKQIEEKDKISKVALDVFFHKTDACIIGFNAFQTMIELNPQLKKKLKILETSSGYIKGLVCIRKDFYPNLYTDVLNGLFNLTNSESGNQILKFFGQSRLIPFESHFLDNIEKLLSDNQKLKGITK